MRKLHVIWDLDGTLINSRDEVFVSLVKSVKDAGLSELQQVAPLRVGPTVDKILELSFPKDVLTTEVKERVIKSFRFNYDNCGFNNTLPFYGISDILKDIRFIHHIVTNKPDLPTKRILEKLGWNTYFDSVITPYSFIKSSNDKRKSKSEIFAFLLQQFPNDSFVCVGDMATDAEAALNNSITSIGVLWGEGSLQELTEASCSVICNTVQELLSVLEKFL